MTKGDLMPTPSGALPAGAPQASAERRAWSQESGRAFGLSFPLGMISADFWLRLAQSLEHVNPLAASFARCCLWKTAWGSQIPRHRPPTRSPAPPGRLPGENAPARRGMARRIASFSDRSTSPASSTAMMFGVARGPGRARVGEVAVVGQRGPIPVAGPHPLGPGEHDATFVGPQGTVQMRATPVRSKNSAPCCRFVPQLAEEGGRHQAGPLRLDPAGSCRCVPPPGRRRPHGLEVLVQPLSDLLGEPLLHLRRGREGLDQPGQLGQPKDPVAGR